MLKVAKKPLGLGKALDLMRLPGAKLLKMHDSHRGVRYYIMPGSSRFEGGLVDNEDAEKIKKRRDVFVFDMGMFGEPQSWMIG